ncbi:MAG: hypothetical protein AAF571_15280, partial [Verrucomicrobiota bacterium]
MNKNLHLSRLFLVAVAMLFCLPHANLASSTSEQIAQLGKEVSALRRSGEEDRIKRAVLELALERADHALAADLESEAQTLLADVQEALSQPSSNFASRQQTDKKLPISRALLTEKNNPYLVAMILKAETDLSADDVEWPRATAGKPAFYQLNGDTGIRYATKLMRDYFWLFAHEQSPMRHDPEILKRTLRRAHAFVDAVNLDPSAKVEKVGVIDCFAMEAAYPALYEILALYPGLLLPSQKEAWDNAIRSAKAEYSSLRSLQANRDPWNYNQETARSVALLVMGLYTEDDAMVEQILAHTGKTISMMRPDGAVPYHGDGNPSVNYHNVLIGSLMLIYEHTGHEPILEALKASQWKGPVMGKTDEFWTSMHKKSFRWNFQAGTEAGHEIVAALSENSYLRWLLDRNMQLGSGNGSIAGRDQATWYRSDISAIPLPDNYTIPDRNVGGPRAWYGNFCYAGAFRPNPPEMEGRETLMGAMTVDPEDGRLNSILANVTPRIWMAPEDYRQEGDRLTTTAKGILTTNELAATTITRNYSVSTSVHDITAARKAYQGPMSDWKGRQIWIGMPDRIVGLVSSVPKMDNAEAYAIHGVLRLISGGATGAATTKVLEELEPQKRYRYGQLEVVVHHTTYNSLNGFEVAYRREDYPATELTFSDRDSEPAPAGELNTYSADTDYQFLVEVRPVWAEGD